MVDEDKWHDVQPSLPEGPSSPLFDEYGELRHGALNHELFYFDAETYNAEDELDNTVDACVLDSHSYLINMDKNAITFKKPPDHTKIQPFFSYSPTKEIKKTFKSTAQYARTPASAVLYKHFKASFPTLNLHR